MKEIRKKLGGKKMKECGGKLERMNDENDRELIEGDKAHFW